MAILVNHNTYVISVPKADLTLVQLLPREIYDLDLNTFRVNLKDWEDSLDGMPEPNTHNHNTEVTLGGLTFARVVEILDPYTITFEDGQYAVNLVGANSNVADKVNVNQVSVRSQNSAGLISSPLIEFASFEGGVWWDPTNSSGKAKTGTIHPAGTRLQPTMNLSDVKLIAEYRGLNVIYLMGDGTINSGLDFDRYVFEGQTHVNNRAIVTESAGVEAAVFRDLRITGTLDGGNEITRCVVDGLEYVNGHIHNSGLIGLIVLAGSEDAVLADCVTLDPENPPVINLGGSGQNLIMPNYSGLVTLENMTGDNFIGIGLSAGQITLVDTITAGVVHISGTGVLIDESGNAILSGIWNGGVTVINQLINKEVIAESVWDEPLENHTLINSTGDALLHLTYRDTVYIDVDNGFSGSTYPIGTKDQPSNNLTDVLLLRTKYSCSKVHIKGTLTIDGGEDLSNITFLADRSVGNVLNIVDAITNYVYVQDLTCFIVQSGTMRYTTSVLVNIQNFDGGAKNCLIVSDLNIVGSGSNYLTDCDTYLTDIEDYRSINVGDKNLNLIRCEGNYKITNKIGTGDIEAHLVGGALEVDETCVAGKVRFSGLGTLVDNSDIDCEVIINMMDSELIGSQVWMTIMSDIAIEGSFGQAMTDVKKVTSNKVIKTGDIITIYEDDNTTPWRVYDLTGGGRVEI